MQSSVSLPYITIALWGGNFNPDSINTDQADSDIMSEYAVPHAKAENHISINKQHWLHLAQYNKHLKYQGNMHLLASLLGIPAQ